MEKKWYIINTQTGCEATAKTAIEERVRSQKMEQWFGDILIPSE
ncbi:MAG: transcription termination/antitermination protein NusG, partial [Proteobacteria bacterium]